jgi:hypothetical protein
VVADGGREPLGLALGNNRDLNAPAKMAISDLRLSTSREDTEAGAPSRPDDNPSAVELTLKKAQSNERRIFPLLELGARPSRHLDAVLATLAAEGYQAHTRRVNYEFQRGGHTMLVVRPPAGSPEAP